MGGKGDLCVNKPPETIQSFTDGLHNKFSEENVRLKSVCEYIQKTPED
jgi:hypothetical protein